MISDYMDASNIYLAIEKFRKGNNYEERLSAVAELANIGEPAAPLLIEALKDEDDGVRCWAVLTLGKLGMQAQAALDELACLSKNDRNSWVKYLAQEAHRDILNSAEEHCSRSYSFSRALVSVVSAMFGNASFIAYGYTAGIMSERR